RRNRARAGKGGGRPRRVVRRLRGVFFRVHDHEGESRNQRDGDRSRNDEYRPRLADPGVPGTAEPADSDPSDPQRVASAGGYGLVITMEHTKLTVLYDERCAFCRRSADWLATQPVLAEMELLGAGTPEARRRCSDVTVGGKQLVVVDE